MARRHIRSAGIPAKGRWISAAVLMLAAMCVTEVFTPAVCLAGNAPTGTFSIVAYDSLTGELGVAVQSRAFAVGQGVSWAEAGVGAIATQSQTNRSFGPNGLDLLRQGYSAEEVGKMLLEADEGRENRQLGIVDARGGTFNFTGTGCSAWAGAAQGRGYSCQGNILVSEEVVTGMARAYEDTEGDLGEKLLQALVAAQAAGGDKRGMQSAAILVVRPSDEYPEYRYKYTDLRVEDHDDPINELIRVYRIHEMGRLLEAHARYMSHYESVGDARMADLEKDRIGAMLVRSMAEEEPDAGSLNSLAWFCAINNIYLEEALAAAKQAVELSPDEGYIIDTLAEAYFRNGMVEEAIATIKRAIEIDQEDNYYREQLERFESAVEK
ncbi:MAG: DUF1028 domain-containing protein [bacterium]|jgi:uncharacterized Ntn-hydrolase superfamily protein